MRKNNKVIAGTSFVVLIIIIAFAVIFVSGKDSNIKFLSWKDNKAEQTKKPDIVQDTAPESSTSKMKEGKDMGSEPKKTLSTIKAKAIYISGTVAGDKSWLDKIIQLVNSTELNAVVLDIKEDGMVNYASEVPEVKRNLTYHNLYDADSVLKALHENNIYVIGRIVCFRDPVLAVKRVDLAIKRPNGQIWRENGKIGWTNPYNEEVWKYNIDIAKEAVDKGFDEIQFDYVRFPTTRKSDVDFGKDPIPKADAICNFLKSAYKEIHELKGVPVSADVFGIICESPGDFENIGQDLERVGKDIDYICPMIYPSHYANAAQNKVGQSINGVLFSAPDLQPYQVVYNSLIKAKNRISAVEGYKAKIRPYLQDFTATWLAKGYYQVYGQEQVKQEIKAANDAGFDEWILWNAANNYTKSALETK